MTTTLLVENLPAGTTTDEVQQFFETHDIQEAKVLRIDGQGDKLTATVQVNIDKMTAQAMVDRYAASPLVFKERQLGFYVPTLFR